MYNRNDCVERLMVCACVLVMFVRALLFNGSVAVK